MASKSNLISQYKKEVRRIKQAVRRQQAKNYYYSGDIIPSKPKTITQATIRKLQRITPQQIRKKSQYIDPTTGEIISSAIAREKQIKQERKQQRAQKRKQEPPRVMVLDTIISRISSLPSVRAMPLRAKERFGYKNIESYKNILLNIISANIEEISTRIYDNNYINGSPTITTQQAEELARIELSQLLATKNGLEFALDKCYTIEYDSDEYRVDQSYNELAEFLSRSELSRDIRLGLNDALESEFYEQ